MRFPLFQRGKNWRDFSARELADVMNAVRALHNMTADPPLQIRKDSSAFHIGFKHIPETRQLRGFIIREINNDYLLGDGMEDTVRQHIAKPFHLRLNPFDGQTIDDIQYNYIDSNERTLRHLDGSEQTQLLSPAYKIGEPIFAAAIQAVRVEAEGEDLRLDLVDANVDARSWDGGGATSGFKYVVILHEPPENANTIEVQEIRYLINDTQPVPLTGLYELVGEPFPAFAEPGAEPVDYAPFVIDAARPPSLQTAKGKVLQLHGVGGFPIVALPTISSSVEFAVVRNARFLDVEIEYVTVNATTGVASLTGRREFVRYWPNSAAGQYINHTFNATSGFSRTQVMPVVTVNGERFLMQYLNVRTGAPVDRTRLVNCPI